MMDTLIDVHDNVCEMDIVPHYERTQDAWPSELHKWVDMIKYSIQHAFDIALKGDDSRKSLLDQIMKGIELTPIIIDQESQKFVTIDGSEFKNFGHDEIRQHNEGEMKMAHVAVTRAKENLFISLCKGRPKISLGRNGEPHIEYHM